MVFCDIMSSCVTSLLLNILLLFNIYRREIGCYIVGIRACRSIRPRLYNFVASPHAACVQTLSKPSYVNSYLVLMVHRGKVRMR